MKFLNLVPIPWAKRSSPQLNPAVSRADPVPAMACTDPAVPVRTDTMAVCGDVSEKKRRRSSGHCKTWRPSLDAISENTTLRAAPAVATGKEGQGKGRGKKAKVKGRVMIHTGCDDLRHFGSATMMPSFAPTAFLF